jgi:hypothetical protein
MPMTPCWRQFWTALVILEARGLGSIGSHAMSAFIAPRQSEVSHAWLNMDT